MSTDVAIPADNNLPATVELRNSELVQWAFEARQAAAIAASLAKTSFVPASLRGKPEDITAAILAGQELGLKPMATLRSIDVIQGTPALRAHAMRALVQSHGHDIEVAESSDKHCLMRGRRKGAENWQESYWDIPRAERLGLVGKPEWKKQPKTMLVARATGEICRLVAADVLYAMPYASEELDGTTYEAPRPSIRVTATEVLAGAPQETEPDAEVVPDADEQGWPDTAVPPDAA